MKIEKPKGQCICVSAPARVLGACTRPKKLSCRTFGSPPGLNVRSTQFVAARELELPDQNGCKARKRGTDRNSKCTACWRRNEKAAQTAQRVNMMHVVIGFYPREGRYFSVYIYIYIYIYISRRLGERVL